jgi:signal transduction histidine kinase
MTSTATVLIVDDEAGLRSSLADALTHQGYRVVTADSGETALECIAAQEFDLALIDLRMHGIGGIEVLTALREQSPNTVAIVLTAHGSMETAVEALRQGAHDYLFKPCPLDKIQESVRAGLLKRQQEIEKQTRVKLASDVSHELRNPISTIGLRLQMLQFSPPEKQRHHLDILRQETAHMGNLVEDILTLSRLEAGPGEAELALEDLNAVVEQVVAAQRARAEVAGLELIFEPGADLPSVRIVRDQLVRVAHNLVANAINYTPAGHVRVSTHLAAERGQVCLRVQDTGIGIEPGELPRLFKRFYRSPRAVKSGVSGTGLGLTIAKEIVDLHGGEIEVESQVGEGSTFRVWLPLVSFWCKTIDCVE